MIKIVLAKMALAVMLNVSPADKAGTVETWPENRETPAEKLVRLTAFADTVAGVVLADPDVKDPQWATSVILSVAWHESGLTKHVFTGEGPHARGDGGQSICALQIRIGKGTTQEGWNAEDLLADPTKCVMAGYRKMRQSKGHCKELGPDAALAIYAGGRCSPAALIASQTRMRTARVFLEQMRKMPIGEEGGLPMASSHERPAEALKQVLLVRLQRLSKRKSIRYYGFTFEEAMSEAEDLLGYKENGWGQMIRYLLKKMREAGDIVLVGAKKSARYVDKALEQEALNLLDLRK